MTIPGIVHRNMLLLCNYSINDRRRRQNSGPGFHLHRLDYCNSSSIQNAAARLVTGTPCCDHITPMLCQFHWLPVRRRVACLVHQSLAGQTPAYLTDDIQLGEKLIAVLCVQPPSGNASFQDAQQFPGSKFQCCRPACVEQLAPHLNKT